MQQAPADLPGEPARSRKLAARAHEGRERRMTESMSFALWAAAPAPAAGNGALGMLLPILLFIPLLYFLMIRPQQRRQKQWQEMLGSIKSGDRVTTSGGIRGIILSIKDDSIIIRVAPDNLKLEVAKTAIASVTTQDSASESPQKS
jgi:preprotein translocase subunit YajC